MAGLPGLTEKTLVSVRKMSRNEVELQCPNCEKDLNLRGAEYHCASCQKNYPIIDGIANFLLNPVDAKIQDEFDSRAEEKAGTVAAVRYWRPGLHNAMTRVVDSLKGSGTGTILDIGCGTGAVSGRWVGEATVYGVDCSVSQLKIARQAGLNVYRANALDLPFANEQFDLVTCNEVLQYIADPASLLSEVARVLKPRGRLILSCPNLGSILRKMGRWLIALGVVKFSNIPSRHRSYHELLTAAEEAGLNLTRTGLLYYPTRSFRVVDKVNGLNRLAATNYVVSLEKPEL